MLKTLPSSAENQTGYKPNQFGANNVEN